MKAVYCHQREEPQMSTDAKTEGALELIAEQLASLERLPREEAASRFTEVCRSLTARDLLRLGGIAQRRAAERCAIAKLLSDDGRSRSSRTGE
jgi:hypothetical protein